MLSDPRKPNRLKMSRTQVASLAFLGAVVLLAWGVVVLLISRASEPVGISTARLPEPTKISTAQLPKHTVASVMNDPYDMLPEGRKHEQPWLQVVVAEWRSLTESDAWLLSNYYLEQYPSAEFLTIDFLCDYAYTSPEEFLNAPDRLYNPHVLFRYHNKWYKFDDQAKKTVIQPATIFTKKDYPDFGAECK
jgi:hypothetical protein